ncbi:MAG: Flp pilus assembly complex ATPase component TadA [Gammaproteobacteria bacterium]|nr:Flp pilus assembly complex ATPase component TadA [Gammaproteobacteria bacterium]
MSEAGFKEIGAYLTDQGKISAADLEAARRLNQSSPKGLGLTLVRMGVLSEQDLLAATQRILGFPPLSDGHSAAVPEAFKGLSSRFLREFGVVPLADGGDTVIVAAVDPSYEYPLEALSLAMSRRIDVRIATLADVENLLNVIYGEGQTAMEGIVQQIESADEGPAGDTTEHLRDLAAEAPVIRLVNLLIDRALELRASDIHIEPFDKDLKVRYRIDGVLQPAEAPPVRSAAAVISRIKLMAKIDIAERRRPQDGRIQLKTQGRTVDLRVSTVPTLHGESVVLRLLDRQYVPLELGALGFSRPALSRLHDSLRATHGIILVTGPTGSGKTTTLYSGLTILNKPGVKILTVEDPVEYQLAGVNQIQVKPNIGLDFSNALRAIVRQDPDIIMIGEMRDLETARIAVQSALTGHLVLSTLHTNDASGSITRLLDMGLEDYLIASTVHCVLAQRLVRILCEQCKEPYEPPEVLIRELELDRIADAKPITLYRAIGCESCAHSGYLGRTVIAEIMSMSEDIRKSVLAHADHSEILRTAVSEGMIPMRTHGLQKALQGFTTIEEVSRVIQESG